MLNQTVLFDSHTRLQARMVDFGGWNMPVQYDGILAEHHRVRQDVSMFDTCHMDAFRVDGPGSLDFLSRMLTQDLRTLADGRCRYGFLLHDDGGVLDDLIAYRRSANRWMVVVNAGTAAGDFAWLQKHLPPAGVELEDLRKRRGKIDLQGPHSGIAFKNVLGIDAGKMTYFSFNTCMWNGEKILYSRTGYTGEYGFELYADNSVIVALWEALLKAGVTPAGLGARDTLRLEAGLPLYGHELNDSVTPVEAGMMRYAAKEEDFLGRQSLVKRLQTGPLQSLVGFSITGRQSARNGNRVLNAAGDPIGLVTSGSYAPTLGYAIGYAYVRPDMAVKGKTVTIDLGTRRLDASIVSTPFYRKPS